jgi:hypothetical protein
LTSALQDARFGEALGTQLNSPVVESAAIVVPATAVRPARRNIKRRNSPFTVVVDDGRPHLRPSTPTIDVRDAVNHGIRTALQDARLGEAAFRPSECLP